MGPQFVNYFFRGYENDSDIFYNDIIEFGQILHAGYNKPFRKFKIKFFSQYFGKGP